MPLTREETEFCSRFLFFFPPYKQALQPVQGKWEYFWRTLLYFLHRICSRTAATLVVLFGEKCRFHPMYQSQMEKGPRPQDCNRSLPCTPGLWVMSSDWRHLEQKNDSLAWWGPSSRCAQISWPLELEEFVIWLGRARAGPAEFPLHFFKQFSSIGNFFEVIIDIFFISGIADVGRTLHFPNHLKLEMSGDFKLLFLLTSNTYYYFY